MTEIRGLMQFKEAVLKSLSFNRSEAKQLKAILTFQAPFNLELAKILKVDALFRPNGDPITGIKGAPLAHKLADCELCLPDKEGAFMSFRPSLIHGFKIASDDDLHFSLEFRAYVSGDSQAAELLEFRRNYLSNETDFECAIRSLQGEFDFSGGPASGGTAVDMSASDEGGKVEEEGPLFRDPQADAQAMQTLRDIAAEPKEERERCTWCAGGVQTDEGGLTHTINGETIECPDMKPSGPRYIDPKREKLNRRRGSAVTMSPADVEAAVTVEA